MDVLAPDDIKLPLIGRNIGPMGLGQLLNNYTLLSGKRNRVNVNALQICTNRSRKTKQKTAGIRRGEALSHYLGWKCLLTI